MTEIDHTHATGSCWVPLFVAWAEGSSETLDFEGREVPERLRELLVALEPMEHVVQFGNNGSNWYLQHPLVCRPDLAGCEWNDRMDLVMATIASFSTHTPQYLLYEVDGNIRIAPYEPVGASS